MEAQEFGARLRELRRQLGLTQRALAEKLDVDFSYLSKIESGAAPPPSEKVILRLAEVLNADRDELLTLAGKIPPDIAEALKNREARQLLRSKRTQTIMRTSNKIIGSIKMGSQNLVNYGSTLKSSLSPARIAIATVLVVTVAVALWSASPITDTSISANNEGILYNNEGEYHKAIAAFTKAIELDPNFAPAYSNRGWAYIRLGQYEQAVANCTNAIESDPSLAIAYNNRSWAYIELGQYEQAIADFNKSIEIEHNL